jgi:hypothetical protein
MAASETASEEVILICLTIGWRVILWRALPDLLIHSTFFESFVFDRAACSHNPFAHRQSFSLNNSINVADFNIA